MLFFCIVLCVNRFASALTLIPCLSHLSRWQDKKVAYFGSQFDPFSRSKDLFFLETEIVDNIFQWDVLENMRQIKSYDDMFQAIRALTVQKILKIRISSKNFLRNESFSRFLSNLLFKLYSKKRYNHIHSIPSFVQL